METHFVIEALARPQLGIVTRQQLLDAGLSARTITRMVARGVLIPMHRGVYRAAGAPRSVSQTLLAAALAAGPDAVASHESAAHLLGVHPATPARPQILTPWSTGPKVRGAILRRTRRLEQVDTTRVGPIPTTAPIRTIIDCAALYSLGRLAWLLDRALVSGVARVPDSLARVDELGARGWSGVAMLRILLDERADEPDTLESVGEQWTRRQLCQWGHPEPVSQYLIHDENGVVMAEADLAYPWARLDIEYDGRKEHQERFESDRERDLRLYALGWETFRVTKATKRRPGPFRDAVRRRLGEFAAA